MTALGTSLAACAPGLRLLDAQPQAAEAQTPATPTPSAVSELDPIDLPAARQAGGRPLFEAIKDRRSTKSFQGGPVSTALLANLLWAAFGINRPDTGKRTAPSAMNAQEIDVYVLLAQGAYVYEPKKHRLIPVSGGDLRILAGKGASVKDADVHLLYVADYARTNTPSPRRETYAAAHAGFIGQNVYLFCASEGLGALFHDGADRDALRTALGLRADQSVVFPQAVGFARENG